MTKPTVLIHTDALRREYPANWLLGKSLEARGYKVFLTSRATTHRLLKILTPDVVILSHVFTLSADLLASLHRRGVRIFANEVEGEIEGNEIGISGTYPKGVSYQYFEKIFTWSEWSAKWLVREHNLDPGRVSAVGSTRLSLLRHFRSKPDCHRIGILSRFEIINTFDARHPFENLMSMDTQNTRGRVYLERTLIEMESFSITSQIIESLVSKGIAVSIRPHPNESIEPYQLLVTKYGPLLEVDGGSDYLNWLEKLSIVVGTLSSAYTEPYLLNIPIISTEEIQENSYSASHMNPFVETFLRACYRPRSVAELVQLCSKRDLAPIADADFRERLSAIYFMGSQKDPIENISAQVGSARPGYDSFISVFIRPIKLLVDLGVIAACVLNKNPKRAFRTHLVYNYNSVIHRPSLFMRRIGPLL